VISSKISLGRSSGGFSCAVLHFLALSLQPLLRRNKEISEKHCCPSSTFKGGYWHLETQDFLRGDFATANLCLIVLQVALGIKTGGDISFFY